MTDILPLPDGGHLAYSVQGNGPPLLLVSGLGGQASFWHDVVQACSDAFTVITYDHRGTGASSRCDSPYSITSMANDALALCSHLKVKRPLYVGHSTGGAVGQHLAIEGALDMRGLVLSATFARPCAYFRDLFKSRLQILEHMGIDAYRELSRLVLYPPYWLAQHQVASVNTLVDPLDAVILLRRILAILDHDVLGALGQITCPTLVIGAKDDSVTPDYHSVQLAQAIPHAELILMPRGGHYVPHTEGPSYRAHLLEFLLRNFS